MKKALSLLLALTLVFAMAAPASAAYTGRFSRDGTYNDVAYLISAVCNTRDCRASITYADPNTSVSLDLTVYLPEGAGNRSWSGERNGTYSVSQNFNVDIQGIHAIYKINGAQIAAATVNPG